VATDVGEVLATPTAPNGIIWERLDDLGISWADYAIDLADIMLFPGYYYAKKDHVRTFPQFLTDCANGTLPQVSIISPGQKVYSEENPWDIQLGEAYSASIINAVMHGKAWEKTALLMTYDEHGGYYDHVPPPAAIEPDNIAPRIGPDDVQRGFDVYGPRVPGHIISPFAKKDYVSHVVHDHTSILKFIETKFNLGAMTYRDANADDLSDCFDFDRMAFREPPELDTPALRDGTSTLTPEVPPVPQPVPA
jgi:phospholipase C